MTHGSLFSGIGGFDLAAERVGIKNIFQVEIDKFCKKVLEKNFPNVKKYSDIKKFNGKKYRGKIDIISGGFPCQPFSVAGKRKGKDDDRSLWKEMLRIITEIKPKYIICENVTGIITMELDTVLFDLENKGYKAETFILPAISLNAPHRRDRIWIIAYTNSNAKCNNKRKISSPAEKIKDTKQRQNRERLRGESCTTLNDVANTACTRQPCSLQHTHNGKAKHINKKSWYEHWYEVAAELCGVDDGLSTRVDELKLTKAQHRGERLKGLGNAIVPQIAEIFFETIKTIETID